MINFSFRTEIKRSINMENTVHLSEQAPFLKIYSDLLNIYREELFFVIGISCFKIKFFEFELDHCPLLMPKN
jgi:hypothetical protein